MAEGSKIEAGKIFIGGLSWDTSRESLVKYFSQYGEVSDGVIMVDSVTKLPRGFGFVTFKDYASVDIVIKQVSHVLDGKKIDPKEAITKDHHASSQYSKSSSVEKKVFVGGLPHGCSPEEIKHYFTQFGAVAEVDVKMDRSTNKPRGFAFVEYEDAKHAEKAINKQFQVFKEKKIEVKAAENRTPGGPQPSSYSQQSQWESGSGYGATQASQQSGGQPYNQSYNSYYYYPAVNPYQSGAGSYSSPQTFAPTHATASQTGFPQQTPSYQNGYTQSYGATPYQPQGYASTGYSQPTYSATSAYPQYTSSYSGQTESTGYGQTQSAGYYPSSSYPANYPSDSRYSQSNQRNW